MKKFILIILLFFPIIVLGEDITTQYQKALIATADAFLKKSKNIQYGNERLTYKSYYNVMRSEDYLLPPENANSKNWHYVTCSQFAYSLYYNTFVDKKNNNYEIQKDVIEKEKIGSTVNYMMALANPNNNDTYREKIKVFYLDKSNYSANLSYTDITNAFNLLQIGDIIIYANNDVGNGEATTGHAVVYYGNNQIIESYPEGIYDGIYHFDIKKDYIESLKGSIRKDSLENLKTRVGRFKKLAIIRPLNELISVKNGVKISDYNISNDAVLRGQYPNLIIEGMPDIDRFNSVDIGTTLLYKINLKNVGNYDYKNITIKGNIPRNTTLFLGSGYKPTAGYQVINNQVVWNVNVPKNSTVSLTYRIKVDKDTKLYHKFISNYFYVNNVKINMIDTYIATKFTNDEKRLIRDTANVLKNNVYQDTVQYINDIYKYFNISFDSIDSINRSIFNLGTVTPRTFRDVQPITSSSSGNRDDQFATEQITYTLNKKSDSKYKKMLEYGLYGGIYTIDQDCNYEIGKENNRFFVISKPKDLTCNKKRVRYVKTNDFTIGDILVINNENTGDNEISQEHSIKIFGDIQNMYIYMGNNIFYTIEEGKVTEYNKAESERLLESLMGQDNFYILKPSFIVKEAKASARGNKNYINDGSGRFVEEEKKDTNQESKNNKEQYIWIALIGAIIVLFIGVMIKKKVK